jgi:predicted secreted protein
MQSLRHAHLLARFVLVWFALSIGVAIASPIVKPQAMELICSGAGVMKVLVKTDDGSKEVASYTLDCPLCANNSAPPPPVARLTAEPVQALAHVLQSIPAAHIASLTAAPLPARGPPAFS